ncbi:ceramidase domain-containing protein [Thiobacter aerophilum]|uniref:Ceramidase domain-containing protein n=1 Tax=Thiobacter aerophilum TaxID=3121275 RepID=A0ABV0EGG9_9BURK
MLAYLPQYCERAQSGGLGEPVNTLTNLAFFLAAWWLWRSPAWRGGPAIRLLVVLVAVIGAGSTLWHAIAQPWALWFDVLPIAVFMGVYLWLCLKNVAGFAPSTAAGLFTGFVAVEGVMAWLMPPDLLNGVGFYLPAVAALFTMGGWLAASGQRAGRALLGAAWLMLAAIGARLMDWAVCNFLPVGSHFLWHLLAAAALYLLVRATVPA